MVTKIETNIPMPKGQWRKYPWDELKVGESFIVAPGSNPHQLCRQAMFSRPKKKFEARMVNKINRVWRTK